MQLIQNFIGGKLQHAISGKTLPCFDPATGAEYAQVASSNAEDVAAAVSAAQKAFPQWKATSPEDRSKILRKLAQKISENLESFALAESIDSGKLLKAARTLEIPRSVKNFEFFADAATQFSNESYAMPGGAINYTLREPLGVVGVISPWNLPLYLLTWKIAPALAAGNCVIAKPSEVTPMTAFLLSKMAIEAGVPAGVLNIVHGLGAEVGSALCKHPQVKAISFTGSTATGAQIAKDTAGSFKKISLEMGGKNPFIVFEDVNLEKTTDWAVKAVFSNQGQICLCGSRMLVHEKIYDSFLKLFVQKVKALKVGDPQEESSDQGALVSKIHFEKVSAAVETAKKSGARILVGGAPAKVSGQRIFLRTYRIRWVAERLRYSSRRSFRSSCRGDSISR